MNSALLDCKEKQNITKRKPFFLVFSEIFNANKFGHIEKYN